ncbi:MAG: hypothetical protein R3310_09380, partial [Candidatus Competibacteraceae bacterium]|nr:hypothetical protein [Candidatus Competibacteraceae bacterium]
MAEGRGRLWQIALAGNTLVLLLGVLLLAQGDLLFGPPMVKPGEGPPLPPGSRAERVLLVVMDALRDDTAARTGLMPHLNALAKRGGRGHTQVGALVPATVAAVQVLASGRVPPPAVFLEDFGASTAEHGGIFQVLKQAGRESFAAGIHLWHDLYGPWLAGWETVETLHHDDPRVLAAGIRALQDPRYQLVVIHFARADEAAHRFGPRTAAYAGAAAWHDLYGPWLAGWETVETLHHDDPRVLAAG